MMRLNGRLYKVINHILTAFETERMAEDVLNETAVRGVKEYGEVDFSIEISQN